MEINKILVTTIALLTVSALCMTSPVYAEPSEQDIANFAVTIDTFDGETHHLPKEVLSPDGSFYGIEDLAVMGDNSVLFSSGSHLYRSQNYGMEEWQKILLDHHLIVEGNVAGKLFLSDNNVVSVVTRYSDGESREARLFYSDNNGESWSPCNIASSSKPLEHCRECFSKNGKHMILEYGFILTSTDGVNWTQTLCDSYNVAAGITDDGIFVIGKTDEVHISKDGVNWNALELSIDDIPYEHENDVQYIVSGTKMYILDQIYNSDYDSPGVYFNPYIYTIEISEDLFETEIANFEKIDNIPPLPYGFMTECGSEISLSGSSQESFFIDKNNTVYPKTFYGLSGVSCSVIKNCNGLYLDTGDYPKQLYFMSLDGYHWNPYYFSPGLQQGVAFFSDGKLWLCQESGTLGYLDVENLKSRFISHQSDNSPQKQSGNSSDIMTSKAETNNSETNTASNSLWQKFIRWIKALLDFN